MRAPQWTTTSNRSSAERSASIASVGRTSGPSPRSRGRSTGPASKSSTGYPRAASSTAAVRPDSPPPTTATRFDFRGSRGRPGAGEPCSAQARSRAPMRTASPTSPRLHAGSQGRGQVRAMTFGKGTCLARTANPPARSPCRTRSTSALASTWTGQVAVQAGGCSWMHCASRSRTRCGSISPPHCSMAEPGARRRPPSRRAPAASRRTALPGDDRRPPPGNASTSTQRATSCPPASPPGPP